MFKWFWQNKKRSDGKPYPEKSPYRSPSRDRRKHRLPEAIRRYYVPLNVLAATNKILRAFGERNAEGYAWWSGYVARDDTVQISTVIYPNISTQRGCVHIQGAVLNEMHRQLLDIDQILLVELHTHPPGAGGQNSVDADNAAIFYPGFISIVVPDFASPRFYDLRDCFVYSYEGDSNWHELSRNEVSKQFVIDETEIAVTS